MKRKIVGIFVIGLLIGTGLILTTNANACTGFNYSKEEKVLEGNQKMK